MIIGAGIYPFGRHEESGLSQLGVRLCETPSPTPTSRGPTFSSPLVGVRMRATRTRWSPIGLTGIPFINVKNGCATGGSSLASAVLAIQSGRFDVGAVVGFDKHPRGAF